MPVAPLKHLAAVLKNTYPGQFYLRSALRVGQHSRLPLQYLEFSVIVLKFSISLSLLSGVITSLLYLVSLAEVLSPPQRASCPPSPSHARSLTPHPLTPRPPPLSSLTRPSSVDPGRIREDEHSCVPLGHLSSLIASFVLEIMKAIRK